VIGVVADAPYVTLDDPAPLVVFRPIMLLRDSSARSFTASLPEIRKHW
jgi:hypothetical protein